MGVGQSFPAFVRAEFDGSSNGFRDFEKAAVEAGQNVKRQFENTVSGIQGALQKALTMPRNGAGALDFDTASMRRAAADASALAVETRRVAQAAEIAARETNDTTQATQLYVLAARAAAAQAEEQARALTVEASAYERLQTQLDRTALTTGGMSREATTAAASTRGLANSQRQLSQSSVMAGQQLQDVFIQIQGGQRVSTALAQQIPQLTFAFSNLGGRVGSVARTLSGPWGLAVAAAAYGVGMLIDNLMESEEALKAAELASDGLSDAQSVLGQMFDLTTGKIKAQNEMLRLNVQLTAIQLRADAAAAETKVMAAQEDSGQLSWGAWFSGNGVGNQRVGSANQVYDTNARRKLQEVMTGRGDPAAVAKWAEKADFSNLDITRDEYLDAIARVVETRAKRSTADMIDKSLKDGELDSALRRAGTAKKPRKGAKGADPDKAADALTLALGEANEKAIALRGQFDRMPGDIDKAANGLEDADQIIEAMKKRLTDGKMSEAQKKVAEETKQIAKEAKALAEAAPNRPMQDALTTTEETLRAQQLLLEGRVGEYDTLQDTVSLARALGAESLAQIPALIKKRDISQQQLDIFFRQQERLREQDVLMKRLDRAGLSVTSQLREIDGIRGSIEDAIASAPGDALGAVKGLVGNIQAQFRQLSARQLTERLFGDVFADLEKELQNLDPMKRATNEFVEGTGRATAALAAFTSELKVAGRKVPTAANDNPASALAAAMAKLNDVTTGRFATELRGIVVSGVRAEKAAKIDTAQFGMSADDLYQKTFTRLFERYLGKGSPLARDLGSVLQGYLQAGPVGGGLAGLSALLGTDSGLGKMVESLSAAAPEIAMALEANKAISSLLGNDQIKNGKTLGMISPFLTRIFGSALRGSASISGNGDDFAVAVRGNSGKYQKASAGAADSVISSIQDLADRLGGTVDASRGNVSIGIRKGNYRVDPTGQGRTKAKGGVLDFGDDAEGAARAAMIDLINDGVIQGLRAGTQRLIQAGKDLDAQLQKALDFESVFTRLKEYKDPVGAALDTLDKEFNRLKKIFGEAGASTAEYAELEELYGIERTKAVKEAAERMTASLQSLYDDLRIGDNGKSLRDRLSAAQAAYDPLKARVAAGDRTAYDDFAEAAKALLDIQRQFSGSQTGYFNLLDEVTQLTKARIDAETNVVSLAANRDSPFTSTGQSTGAGSDNAAVVGAIGQTNEILIDGFRALLGSNAGGTNPALSGFLTDRFGTA